MLVKQQIINGCQRYVVVDDITGEVLDDAQGYGFKTSEAARKCYWYKQYHPKTKNVCSDI